jgi:MFS family permease
VNESKIDKNFNLGLPKIEPFMKLRQRLQVDQNVPNELVGRFRHYYLDIAWWGLLNGTTLSFLNYFAVRMGATNSQVALIVAGPAVVSLIFALPAGAILKRFSINRATFISAVITRLFYLVLVVLPLIQNPPLVVALVILITIIMSIPAVFSNVGFNTAFAVNIPDEYRAHVAGVRNAAFAVVTILVSLMSGAILNRIAFPIGYIVVFAIGFVGAAGSAFHLYQLSQSIPANVPQASSDPVEDTMRGNLSTRMHLGYQSFRQQIHFDLLRGPSGRPIFLMTLLTLALYISSPVFPVYLVNRFHFSDQVLSIGMAAFNFTIFLASLNLDRVDRRIGRKNAIGAGFVLMSTFPVFLIFMNSPMVYYVGNLFSGMGSALVNGELYNYLYERIPAKDQTSGVAWFTVSSNAAVLVGSLLGPVIANQFGFVITMVILAALRFIVSLMVLRWG